MRTAFGLRAVSPRSTTTASHCRAAAWTLSKRLCSCAAVCSITEAGALAGSTRSRIRSMRSAPAKTSCNLRWSITVSDTLPRLESRPAVAGANADARGLMLAILLSSRMDGRRPAVWNIDRRAAALDVAVSFKLVCRPKPRDCRLLLGARAAPPPAPDIEGRRSWALPADGRRVLMDGRRIVLTTPTTPAVAEIEERRVSPDCPSGPEMEGRCAALLIEERRCMVLPLEGLWVSGRLGHPSQIETLARHLSARVGFQL
mmetsp:Transcript_76667/g.220001  ORF Transcript_76667/g.220001 Transcript_76667/m.220001 type:complete len:258 (-) Transcript_76667:99-872(-)